jgi:hypothetical protein
MLVWAALLWAYLPTTEMDFFPWGQQHLEAKGWYSVAILFIAFPMILICFLLKYWGLRKMEGVVFYRLTPLFVFLVMIITFFNIIIFAGNGNAATLFMGLATAVFSVVEIVWFAQGRTPWRNTTSW